jgi:hyaluronoglucosaminidase
VSKRISLAHVRQIATRLNHKLILWDNYPVNDLSMRDELHIAPLQGRDPRLPESVYGYLNNPLLQEELSFIPLATCFDYAARPTAYDGESSWTAIVQSRFGAEALPHWQTIRKFCDESTRTKKIRKVVRISPHTRTCLTAAIAYVHKHRRQQWAREIRPWLKLMTAATR